MKKFLSMSILASLLALLLNFTSVSAQDLNFHDEITRIENQYDNIKVTDLTTSEVDYSKAIYVDSIEEYQGILQALSISSEQPHKIYFDNTTSNYTNLYGNSMLLTTSDKVSDIWSYPLSGVTALPPVNINVQFHFSTYAKYGALYFGNITDINSWLSGIQFPVAYDWKQQSSSFTLNDGGKNADVTVTGVLGWTVIIKDLPKLVETTQSYTSNWNPR